jgi:hypothetical protein
VDGTAKCSRCEGWGHLIDVVPGTVLASLEVRAS